MAGGNGTAGNGLAADIDRDRFLREGYLVVPEVIEPARLPEVRRAYEILVERQRAVWAAEREPGDPPGGMWETARQPRLHLSRELGAQVDGSCAAAVEIWTRDRLRAVADRLLGVEDAGATELMMMCSPVRDHGPANWHRDIHPIDTAPLRGYIDDIVENGPAYIQWNIPLYDDDVLWVMPGTHVRVNTDRENRLLLEDNRRPLPDAVQTHLRAGDGVVYITPILHWGSNYSARLRRTVHGGFSPFALREEDPFVDHLQPPAQEIFRRWRRASDIKKDRTEAALRAALAGDASAYDRALAALRPGVAEKGKLLQTVFLTKAALFIRLCKRPELRSTVPERVAASSATQHPITLNYGPRFAERFTPDEAELLWRRFAPMEARLNGDEEGFMPGFQAERMHHSFVDMPAGFGVAELTATWAQVDTVEIPRRLRGSDPS
ncbi:MAG: hypothetical protein OXJ90_04895 [Spirochaetaceae bacterium]|nr:hypothetical protein [Spirochaetaceae bacterium]